MDRSQAAERLAYAISESGWSSLGQSERQLLKNDGELLEMVNEALDRILREHPKAEPPPSEDTSLAEEIARRMLDRRTPGEMRAILQMLGKTDSAHMVPALERATGLDSLGPDPTPEGNTDIPVWRSSRPRPGATQISDGLQIRMMPNPLYVPGDAIIRTSSDARLQANDASLFVSYRRQPESTIPWIRGFVTDLQGRGYRIACDLIESQSSPTGMLEELRRSKVFVAIFTEEYVQRISYGEVGRPFKPPSDDGWLFDEWGHALERAGRGETSLLGIWRSGSHLPMPFFEDSICDARDDDSYERVVDEWFPRRSEEDPDAST